MSSRLVVSATSAVVIVVTVRITLLVSGFGFACLRWKIRCGPVPPPPALAGEALVAPRLVFHGVDHPGTIEAQKMLTIRPEYVLTAPQPHLADRAFPLHES